MEEQNNIFSIEPVDYQQLGTIVDQAVKIKIEPFDIHLNSHCMLRVTFYNQYNIVLITREFEVSPEEYALWNEDSYLISLACTKTGVTLLVEGE